jgi:hypothetical protein
MPSTIVAFFGNVGLLRRTHGNDVTALNVHGHIWLGRVTGGVDDGNVFDHERLGPAGKTA